MLRKYLDEWYEPVMIFATVIIVPFIFFSFLILLMTWIKFFSNFMGLA